jgi:hypothetical protein
MMLQCSNPDCQLCIVDVCEMRFIEDMPVTVSTAVCKMCGAQMVESEG